MNLKKGQRVVKLYNIRGEEFVSEPVIIGMAGDGWVSLEGSYLRYSSTTGQEIESSFPECSCRLVLIGNQVKDSQKESQQETLAKLDKIREEQRKDEEKRTAYRNLWKEDQDGRLGVCE